MKLACVWVEHIQALLCANPYQAGAIHRQPVYTITAQVGEFARLIFVASNFVRGRIETDEALIGCAKPDVPFMIFSQARDGRVGQNLVEGRVMIEVLRGWVKAVEIVVGC